MGRSKKAHYYQKKPHGSHAGTRAKTHGLITGVLHVNSRGAGSVETPEGLFSVPPSRIYEAMNGDTVQLRVLPGALSQKEPFAAVTHVLDRAVSTFAARFEQAGSLRVLVALDDRLCHDFILGDEDRTPFEFDVEHGDIVGARILLYPTRKAPGVATIVRKIDATEGPLMAIETVIAAHDLETEFANNVLQEARSLKFDLGAALAEPLRRDIRDRFVVTVDPDDARDFDDAVSLEKHEGGGWLLGVHIADVSAYVPWGSAIDLAARKRATSVYLADRVLPMLPEELSCELCSLKPKEDRLAMTVDLELDTQGRVVFCECYPSIITSNARMRYSEVDRILVQNEQEPYNKGPYIGSTDIGAFFAELNTISNLRYKLRQERGALEFVTSETKVLLDTNKNPVDIEQRVPTPATRLIEEAMLMANEAVARRLLPVAPAAFRVHEAPHADTIQGAMPLLGELGVLPKELKPKFALGDAHAIQQVLAQVSETPLEGLVNTILLRCMTRAVYEPLNAGHYGLGAEAYCHFTSPIRRYPDLVVHRCLKALLGMRGYALSAQEKADLMPSICAHSSRMERVAAAAAAESQNIMAAEYMQRFIGKAFSGTIVSVQPFGVFVRLDDFGVEGLLHMRDLSDDWLAHDADRFEIHDAKGEHVWRLGQTIAVVVSSCDTFRGRIDFSLPRKTRSHE